MQKRLSVARALLRNPVVLLVDEATHDLDPEGSRRVRELIAGIADRGTGVVWATQRIDEVRGFADEVTLLNDGCVGFQGPTAHFVSHAQMRRHVLVCDQNGSASTPTTDELTRVLAGHGTIESLPDAGAGYLLLVLAPDGVLGDAIAALARSNVRILACREERSEMEAAFAALLERTKQ